MTDSASIHARPTYAARIGAVIAHARRFAGITQDELARHLDVTKSAVSKWEMGQSAPDVALVPRIAAFFGITCDELLGYAEEVDEKERDRILRELVETFDRDFGEGLSACRRCERAHWRDWPLLSSMVLALLNAMVRRRDRVDEACAYLDALLVRIEDECPDRARCHAACLMRASLMMLSQEPSCVDEGVALLESLADRGGMAETAVSSALASAYDQVGRGEDAQVLRQRIVYASGLSAVGECLNQMKCYEGDLPHMDALARAARGIAEVLQLDVAAPLTMLSMHVQCALAFKGAGMRDEALEEVERLCRVIDEMAGDPYAAPRAHEAILFDRIAESLKTDASQAPLASASGSVLLGSSVAMVLAGANWDDCADDPRYRALLARQGEGCDAMACWVGEGK